METGTPTWKLGREVYCPRLEPGEDGRTPSRAFESLSFRQFLAALAQWQGNSLPSCIRGFDSRRSLQHAHTPAT